MGINIKKIDSTRYLLDIRVKKAGKEFRKRELFTGTRIQAQEKFVQLKKELRTGVVQPSPSKVRTLGDVLTLYKAKKGCLPSREAWFWEVLYRDLGGARIELLPDRLEDYHRLLQSAPSKKTGKPLGNATINRLMTLVHAALNMAVHMEALDRNPLSRHRFPRLKEIPRDKVLTAYEVQRLLNAIEKHAPYLGPVVRYALQVPCRKSELVRMRQEDVDLVHDVVRVRNGTTKNAQGGWKPIPPDMRAYFRSIPKESPWVFNRAQEGTYKPLGDFKKAWATCLRLAGIEDFHFHDTRHISATNLLNNGTPQQAVLAVAGWKTDMLSRYYHRAGKDTLGLLRFHPGSGHSVDTFGVDGTRGVG